MALANWGLPVKQKPETNAAYTRCKFNDKPAGDRVFTSSASRRRLPASR